MLVVPAESAAAQLLDLVDAERRLFVTFESLAAALESFGVDRAIRRDVGG